jgi:hypothetical protein
LARLFVIASPFYFEYLYQHHSYYQLPNFDHCVSLYVRFCNKSGLNVHLMRHTGELPFVCTICKKGFKQNFELKNHVLRHIQNPYICKTCDRGFKDFHITFSFKSCSTCWTYIWPFSCMCSHVYC